MCVNGKSTDVIPRLKIDGVVLQERNCVTYLGDQFNEKGGNKDLVHERTKKGQSCIVNAMSLCSDVTMGVYTLQTLFLLYKSLFLQVVLHNAQAWTNIIKEEITSLQTIQLKYIKRIFHVPSSTPNSVTFLETGILPIEQEIDVRRLNFLHHILSLDHDDPVRSMYSQQLKYTFEKNWANNVRDVRESFGIECTDEEVSQMTNNKWGNIVKRKAKQYALTLLNTELSKVKIGNSVGQYNQLKRQEYISSLPPSHARKLFQVRTGVIDLRAIRKYWYNDPTCRLCKDGEEDVEHVVNKCCMITRTHIVDNVYSSNEEDMKEVARRCFEFSAKVEQPSPS